MKYLKNDCYNVTKNDGADFYTDDYTYLQVYCVNHTPIYQEVVLYTPYQTAVEFIEKIKDSFDLLTIDIEGKRVIEFEDGKFTHSELDELLDDHMTAHLKKALIEIGAIKCVR